MQPQWNEVTSLPQSSLSNYISSQIGIFDYYVLYQTAQYEYQAIIWNHFGKAELYRYYRTGTTYSTSWVLQKTEATNLNYSVSNPLYCYSNIADGIIMDIPVNDISITWAVMITCSLLCIKQMFHGWRRKNDL